MTNVPLGGSALDSARDRNDRFDRTDRPDTAYLSGMLKRTAWGAIIAGAAAAIGLQMVFTLLGLALGFSSVDAGDASNPNTRENISTAAGVWWLISGTAALFLGGCIVGRVTGMVRSTDILLHAFVMWAVTAIFGFAVVYSSSGVLANAGMHSYLNSSPRSGMMGGMGNVGGTSAPSAGQTGENVAGNLANRAAANTTTADAEQARRVARSASWWSLIAFLLGIAASLIGAWITAPDRIIVRSPAEGRPEPRTT